MFSCIMMVLQNVLIMCPEKAMLDPHASPCFEKDICQFPGPGLTSRWVGIFPFWQIRFGMQAATISVTGFATFVLVAEIFCNGVIKNDKFGRAIRGFNHVVQNSSVWKTSANIFKETP